MDYRISSEKPWAFDKCHEKFGVSWEGTIVAMYDTIHCADPSRLTADIIEHEIIHLKQQQEIGLETWWDKYLSDNAFRLSMELPAYRRQYKYLKSIKTDRNQIARWMHEWALNLSGKGYGYCTDYQSAINEIKK